MHILPATIKDKNRYNEVARSTRHLKVISSQKALSCFRQCIDNNEVKMRQVPIEVDTR